MLRTLLVVALTHNGAACKASAYVDAKGRGNWPDEEAAIGFVTALRWLEHIRKVGA
jgi:hypothetical protein